MKICILEDDKAQAERMTQYLDRYRREHADFSYELERYARAFDLLEDYRGDADLLFLDIRLPDQLGIETARRIREKDSRVMIVFVTNLAQYAIEGYSVQAFDYILKPVDYFAFSVKLERALRALSARADGPVLDVKTREGLLRRIPADTAETAYPAYEVDSGLTLIDMMGVDYDDPQWDAFMDQLSWGETAKLVANGYHMTAMVDSVGKPETNDENGPNGFNAAYNAQKEGLYYRKEAAAGNVNSDGSLNENADPNGEKKTTAFPANGIIAATYNRDLAYRVGKIIGEDGIWSGMAGLYGIGANIHRSPYLGRTAEYYSECGTLTGMMAAAECQGIEEKGVHVYNKHCVVNDQETARHGVAVWINEQALREIYLRAFEIPIEEGNAYGTMASFARLGTMAGPSDGTLGQDFLRGECGMKGAIVTDMYTDMNGAQDNSPYFELAYGIYTGGCDIPDGSGQEAQFDAYRPDSDGTGDYATMAWRMRESAKRICYATVNSNAMNGIAVGTEIVPSMPWWQQLLYGVVIGSGVLLVLCAAWIVVTATRKRKKA